MIRYKSKVLVLTVFLLETKPIHTTVMYAQTISIVWSELMCSSCAPHVLQEEKESSNDSSTAFIAPPEPGEPPRDGPPSEGGASVEVYFINKSLDYHRSPFLTSCSLSVLSCTVAPTGEGQRWLQSMCITSSGFWGQGSALWATVPSAQWPPVCGTLSLTSVGPHRLWILRKKAWKPISSERPLAKLLFHMFFSVFFYDSFKVFNVVFILFHVHCSALRSLSWCKVRFK
jgi:hypothetical protein